ncbi:MAG: ATP-binding protein [candidate division Zixibacteria bacterium]|nr:ATP-binding protein [candidate division Zixibacteria bacterium]
MAFMPNMRGELTGLYLGRSALFKVFLVGGALVISALFIWYTFVVIEQLQRDTRDQVDKYVRLWQLAANAPTSGDALPFIFDEIIVKARFPIVVLDADKKPVSWRNIPGILSEDTSQAVLMILKAEADDMYRHNGEYPLYFGENNVNYLRYGDSEVINQLRVMPFVAVGLVLAFLLAVIVGFQNIRRSEERFIWVGMAKETAHQLGTPLSSLLGWLEVIDPEHRHDIAAQDQEQLLDSTVANMKMDVNRLQRVATRFGQIGSVPEMRECDLNAMVTETVQYYRARLPFEGHGTQIIVATGDIPPVRLNPELFSWVLENLIKNSLQAVDPKSGQVTVTTSVSADRRTVTLDISDNGRGIPPGATAKIFHPGFTTKKRGWGMGLTLVKRIVEEYHVGRIQLLRSQPGDTVFRVTLPISGRK